MRRLSQVSAPQSQQALLGWKDKGFRKASIERTPPNNWQSLLAHRACVPEPIFLQSLWACAITKACTFRYKCLLLNVLGDQRELAGVPLVRCENGFVSRIPSPSTTV